MIYFVINERRTMVKIGFTAKNASKRLSQLQTGSPERLYLLGCIKGCKVAEGVLHAKFKKFRSHGEWFHFNQIRACVEQLISGQILDGSQYTLEQMKGMTGFDFEEIRNLASFAKYHLGLDIENPDWGGSIGSLWELTRKGTKLISGTYWNKIVNAGAIEKYESWKFIND